MTFRPPDHEADVDVAELLKEVRRIEVQSSRLVTDVMAGGYSSVFRGSGIEFEEVREYEEGDDPRSVDWNVTARTGRPHVKKFVDERRLTVLFVLDLSASMTGGFGAWSVRQAAARICACLALSAVKNNDLVGLIAFSGGVEKYVEPRKGFSHTLRIVRDFLALPAGGLATDPGPALEHAARVLRRRAVIFLVSDFLSDGWQRALPSCTRRHDVIAVRMNAPEFKDPPRGLMRVHDPETGREHVVDWSNARVRAAFAERVVARRRRTDVDLRRARVDVMDVQVPRVPSAGAVARPILGFFRMRELRGEKR